MSLNNEQRGNLLLLAHNVHHNRPWEDVAAGYLRYEALRKLNVPAFRELFCQHLVSGRPFDEMVDELVLKGAGK